MEFAAEQFSTYISALQHNSRESAVASVIIDLVCTLINRIVEASTRARVLGLRGGERMHYVHTN